jgi:hypothetical protein
MLWSWRGGCHRVRNVTEPSNWQVCFVAPRTHGGWFSQNEAGHESEPRGVCRGRTFTGLNNRAFAEVVHRSGGSAFATHMSLAAGPTARARMQPVGGGSLRAAPPLTFAGCAFLKVSSLKQIHLAEDVVCSREWTMKCRPHRQTRVMPFSWACAEGPNTL